MKQGSFAKDYEVISPVTKFPTFTLWLPGFVTPPGPHRAGRCSPLDVQHKDNLYIYIYIYIYILQTSDNINRCLSLALVFLKLV